MAVLEWDKSGEKTYEAGVEKGVLYKQAAGLYPAGVAWNGLTALKESPSGAEATALYANNRKYANLLSAEEFGATIEAYTYPKAFEECDGSLEVSPGVTIGQQNRVPFGLSYQTKKGNDTDGNDYGYKIHIVYGALAGPSEVERSTLNNEAPDAITFSWTITTTAASITNHKPSSTLVIDSTTTDATKLASLEAILYGTEEVPARLPLPDEIITLIGPIVAG